MTNKDWKNLETGWEIYEAGDKKNLKISYGFAHDDLSIIKLVLK